MLDPSPSKITVSICSKLSCSSIRNTIIFITHFPLKILERNSKLVVLINLGMPGHTNLKLKYQFEETFHVYLQAKNQLHPSRFPSYIAKILQNCFPSYIAKILQNCYFAWFGHAWLCTPKVILWTCRKFSCLFFRQKSTSFPFFSGDIAKILHIILYDPP